MKEKILRSIKQYSTKPLYILKVQAEACEYEVLLNGIPVISMATRGGTSNEAPLNNYILKSGRQALTVNVLPLAKNRPFDANTSFTADVALTHDAGGGRTAGSFTQLARAALPPGEKKESLPAFSTTTFFEAKVPWDYSAMLATAQVLPTGTALHALLQRAVGKMHTAIRQKDGAAYQRLIADAVAKESDVLYRTPAEVDEIVAYAALTDVKEAEPLPQFEERLFADGKLVQAVGDTTDEYGARSVIRFSTHSLEAGDPDGVGTEDHLYYLPRGASELQIF